MKRWRSCRPSRGRWLGVVMCIGWMLEGRVQAKPVPSEPILRVETGMHTAPIKRIGVDAAGRYLVTGSDDKTVRVWDLATKALVRTLRLPIGAASEGKVYAVALSPDGNIIAAGGSTGREWSRKYSIYLFDRQSGRIRHRLPNIPQTINHLVFSRDGRRLAATLGGSGGVVVFAVPEGTELGRDTRYTAASYGADFDRNGRLVTTSHDRMVRLYDTSLRRLYVRPASRGSRPHGIRFSPDGERIAVGYADIPLVDILSPKDLLTTALPESTGIDTGDLASVAWSSDGAGLYAAGAWTVEGEARIRRWSQGGDGPIMDVSISSSAVSDLATLPQGIVFGASDPAWGLIAEAGTRLHLHSSAIAQFRGLEKAFAVDSGGVRVRFSYERFGVTPAMFSLPERQLILWPTDSAALKVPITTGMGIRAPTTIQQWTLGDTPLTLPVLAPESVYGFAIASNGRFLLGTERNLYCFDADRLERWRVALPGPAWAVNYSGDSRLAVAALGDGTIRWYRIRDGKELLAFFPHADQKRWIAWTPAGYYDASVGGEDLILWHVNRGPDQAADAFPVSQFRHLFYRPDIVARALNGEDPVPAPDIRQTLPPIVRILSPEPDVAISESRLSLRLSLRSPSGESIRELQVLIDGRPAHTEKLTTDLVEGEYTLTLTLPERNLTLSILARTASSSWGEAAALPLRFTGTPPPPVVADLRPKLYILSVGVTTYQHQDFNGTSPLRYPAADARAVADLLKAQEGKLYRQVVTRILPDGAAKKDAILDGLEWLQRETTQRDVALLFLAGHGVLDPGTGRYYFVPYDAEPNVYKRSMLAGTEIQTTLDSIPGKVLLFLDTCHSGALFDRALRGPELSASVTRFINELTSVSNGVVVLTASTGTQAAQEDQAWGNGAFTKAVLEGLRGLADPQKTGRITWQLLGAYVSERVKQLTGGQQAPITANPTTISDFPLATAP